MTEPTEQVHLTPRGIGNNNLPCGWCSINPAPRDMASFVWDQERGELAVKLLAEAGITAELELGRADEGRFQVKIGACEAHLINLDFLGMLLTHNPLTVKLARRTKPVDVPDRIPPDLLAAIEEVVAGRGTLRHNHMSWLEGQIIRGCPSCTLVIASGLYVKVEDGA